MGHQFFERLAGRAAKRFQFVLGLPQPDVGAVVDSGVKLVHNRVLMVFAAGDLERVVAAVRTVSETVPVNTPDGLIPIRALAHLIHRLRGCEYPDEAQQIGVKLIRTICIQGTCDLNDALRVSAQFFGDQCSRVEAVYRVPSDGLFGMQELATDIATRMATRVADNLIQYRREDPLGWRENRWMAPRARTRSSKMEDIGNELDISKE